MCDTRLKAGVLILEGLNSFATTYYLYYFYFFMQKQFGFGDKANLGLAALNGLVCAFAAWWGGRFAQRAGYFTALKLGFALMTAALLVGGQLDSPGGHVAVMLVAVIGMCFTWPTLEALVSEDETPAGLQHMIGIYNIVWAGTGALAYFIGGALLDTLGLKSLFYVPTVFFVAQLGLTFWLHARENAFQKDPPPTPPMEWSATTRATELFPSWEGSGAGLSAQLNPRPIAQTRAFLRMAWLTNPFAYIAINT